MSKISVIIPVYNVEKYLKRCLDSIVNQSFKDIEIICVNDGSTDNSLRILNEYANKDARFVVIDQSNTGQGIARNNALRQAKGEYIAFVDPDDWLEKDVFEKLYNFAKENNAKVVQFDYRECFENSDKTKDIIFSKAISKKMKKDFSNLKSYNYKDFKKECLQGLDFHAFVRIYEKDFIINNSIEFAPTKRGEDHIFAQSVILLADKVFYYPKVLYNYNCRETSTVNTQSHDNLKIFINIELLEKFLKTHNLLEELKNELERYKESLLEWHYEQTLPEDIEEYEKLCQKYLTNEQYEKVMNKAKKHFGFWENVFSVKNAKINGQKCKIVTILGFKKKFIPK